jgi:hypothetical protein
MPLLALDQLARIKPVRIDAGDDRCRGEPFRIALLLPGSRFSGVAPVDGKEMLTTVLRGSVQAANPGLRSLPCVIFAAPGRWDGLIFKW